MTQPVRLKVTATSRRAEKPPSIDMKLLVKRMFYRYVYIDSRYISYTSSLNANTWAWVMQKYPCKS